MIRSQSPFNTDSKGPKTMKYPSDMSAELPKMPEPFAWASSLSIERIKVMSGAWVKIVLRILPESGDVPLYTAADLELAKQGATRQAMERLEPLRHAGARLSNCAFNLAQRNPGEFTAREIESLDSSRKAWDEAVRALAKTVK